MTEEQSLRLSVLSIIGRHDDWRERAEAMLAWVTNEAPASVENPVAPTTAWTPERIALLKELRDAGIKGKGRLHALNRLPGKRLSEMAVRVYCARHGLSAPSTGARLDARRKSLIVARAAKMAKAA